MDRREELKRQLMATFQAELEEHLGTLNRGLLALEEGRPGEEKEVLLADLFRATHSLKGAARAVDLRDIEAIAHRLEDVLGAVQRAEIALTAELFDLIFRAVDILREAMAAYLQGTGLLPEVREELLGRLEATRRGESTSAKAGEIPAAPVPSQPPAPLPVPEPVSVPSPLLATPLAMDEETIRVATEKLDRLMDGMGELMVARMRTEQRLLELRALWQRLARWEKDWRLVRTHYRRAQRQPGEREAAMEASPYASAGADLDWVPLLDFLAVNEQHLKALSAEMNDLQRSFAGDRGHLTLLADNLQDEVRRMRMLPIATLFDPFPRMMRDLARERGKEVSLEIEGADTEVDRQVLEMMKDPLVHLLRNALDHGIESPAQREAAGKPRRGTVHLRAAQKGNTIVLEVADDGAGINLEAVRRAAVGQGLVTALEASGLDTQETIQLIFRLGLSTKVEVTDLSGRGVGLDVVRQNLERLHGLVQVDTAAGQGTTFTLTLPLTLATSQVLLVRAAGQLVALPTTTVERILRVPATDVGRIEGKPAIRSNGRPLPLVPLDQVLELPHSDTILAPEQRLPVVILGIAERRIAFRVDSLEGTQEVVVKSLGRQLRRVRNVAGATILGTGEVVMILNVADLVKSAQETPAAAAPLPVEVQEPPRRRVLVVDDSITTRTLEKNILENSGYRVWVAADGEEAWALMQSEPLDLVVSDIAMPRMDGFVLTEQIRGDERFRDLPVVLVTSLESQRDRQRGLEAGADAYITKSAFDQQNLLEAIEHLIG
jgi:two-component system chemotaxis sensor kinase CheA